MRPKNSRALYWLAMAAGLIGQPVAAQQFTPPVGYAPRPDATARPCVAPVTDASTPRLTCIPIEDAAKLFKTDPTYPRADKQLLKVVGAYSLTLPAGESLVAAKSPGYLPVELRLSGGNCFSLNAEYYGKLSDARVEPTSCDDRSYKVDQPTPQPADKSLRFVGTAWGYDAWADPKAHHTVITAPFLKTFRPLFTADLPVIAIMAMNSPDAPLGNVTLVGRLEGQIAIFVLEVSF